MKTADLRARWPAITLLDLVAVASALVLYGAVRFPGSMARGGIAAFWEAGAGLMLYALIGLCAYRSRSSVTGEPLRIGTILGLCIAAVAAINHSVEISSQIPPWAGAVLGAGMWAFMFFAIGSACSAVVLRGHSIAQGILAGAWAAMIYTAGLVAFALSVPFLFMHHMERVLYTPYAAGGITDPASFVVQHEVSCAAPHLFIGPAVALMIGGLSGLACLVLKSVSRRTAVAVAGGALVLFIAAILSIRIATPLPRTQRPPFILFGLGGLMVTLASAYPLFATISVSPNRSALKPGAP